MKLFKHLFVIGILLAGSSSWAAAENSQPAVPQPIQNLVADGAQLRYLGRDNGMDGWLILKNGEEQYYYSTLDGQGIVMGILFNNKGDAVTLRQVNELRKKEGPAIDRLAGYPEPEANRPAQAALPASSGRDVETNAGDLLKTAVKPKSEQLFDAVEAANWVVLGSDKAPPVYSFIDPECPHCHDMIQDIRKSGYLEQGLLQLRLIPVGVLSENSLYEAAFLLASPTAQQDIFSHLDGKKDVLLADKSVNTQGVQRNIKLMQDWSLDVTPFTVYRARDGKVKVLQGRPDDLKKIITELR